MSNGICVSPLPLQKTFKLPLGYEQVQLPGHDSTIVTCKM